MAIAGRFASPETRHPVDLLWSPRGSLGFGASLLRRDLLDKRHLREPGSAWKDSEREKPSLERSEHQF